jgi:D-3-phosphoglycerate dehydrogenase / 2-oxoglutarate reductase
MIRVLLNDGLDKKAIESLNIKGFQADNIHIADEELGQALKDYDVLVVRSATKVRENIIRKAKDGQRLKLIIRGGVGVDNIDVKVAKELGIDVKNTPSASSASVAELAIGHMFAVSRFIAASNVTMREGKWEKKKYKGIELSGKTLGLIGAGRIAKEVAVRAKALGMKVIYTSRSGEKESFKEFKYYPLEELLKTSDFVSLHIPFDKSSGALIGEKEINFMKDGSYLINCARGGVVDEEALLNALNSGKLAGAGIDVYVNEPTNNFDLIKHPNVSVTPHIGASTKEAQERIGEEVVSILEEYFR